MTNNINSNDPASDPDSKPIPQFPVSATPTTPSEHKINANPKNGADDKQSTAKELAREFRWVEFAQLIVNGILAIIGIIAVCIYGGQLDQMKSSVNQTERAVILNLGQLSVANRNAKTAENVLEYSKNALAIQTRPWIGFSIKDIEIRHDPPNVSVAQGRFVFTVDYTITNYGSSPALDVASDFTMLGPNEMLNVPNRKLVCDNAIRTSMSDNNKIQDYLRRSSVFPTQKVDKAIPEMFFLFDEPVVHVIGCFAYHGIVGEKTRTTYVDFSFTRTKSGDMEKLQSEQVIIRKIDAQ